MLVAYPVGLWMWRTRCDKTALNSGRTLVVLPDLGFWTDLHLLLEIRVLPVQEKDVAAWWHAKLQKRQT
jgi:hypothetical protein